MPFISSYKEANKILTEIGNGTCNKGCKKVWIRNLKYALKTKTNPLALNKKQRTNMTKKLKSVSGKNTITSAANISHLTFGFMAMIATLRICTKINTEPKLASKN